MLAYRIIHIDNFPNILKYGILHRDHSSIDEPYINIGDSSIIEARDSKVVNIDDSGEMLKIGQCIPFYFTKKSPMLYVLQRNNYSAENIIYIVCSVEDLLNKYDCFVSDGNARTIMSRIAHAQTIQHINDMVDWDCITASQWGGELLEVKRKKQAELLIRSHKIGFNDIKNIICYNAKAQKFLLQNNCPPSIIEIDSMAYF